MIHKEELREVLKDNATRTFHDEETDLIEMLIPVPLATDIICQYVGIGAKNAVSEAPQNMPDMVQKPPHYNKFSFQPIDVISEVTNYYEGSTAFHIGTALKYLCRAPFKGKLLEDLKKANYYLTRAITEMEDDGE